MKKDTKHSRAQMVNVALAYIYKYIDTQITLEELAKLNSVSKYHFHRIFKEETNENLFDRITSIRLQKAANLLITNRYSTISDIALMCGYSSHSSFIKAFKQRFSYTPTQWKKGAFLNFSQQNVTLKEQIHEDFYSLQPIIKVIPKRICAYIRHKGYNKDVSNTWQRLMAFAYEKNLDSSLQIGVFHDNPVITPNKECQYIAAFEIEENFKCTNSISKLEVPESLCAVFHYEGVFGDVVKLMVYIYHLWLPNSGYEAKTIPAYAIYHKNHFLEENDSFIVDLHIPIRVV